MYEFVCNHLTCSTYDIYIPTTMSIYLNDHCHLTSKFVCMHFLHVSNVYIYKVYTPIFNVCGRIEEISRPRRLSLLQKSPIVIELL